MSAWIDVNDTKQPVDGQEVLVVRNKSSVEVARVRTVGGKIEYRAYCPNHDIAPLAGVTHWMELPKYP